MDEIEAIHRADGFVRIHCYGRVKNILPTIIAMGADGLKPVESPPAGDVDLSYVRTQYGRDLVLFGNLEVTDIENLEPAEFSMSVIRLTQAQQAKEEDLSSCRLHLPMDGTSHRRPWRTIELCLTP